MHVRFVVGPNGVGKSQYLINIARQHVGESIFVCNTVHDRSASLKRAKRTSAQNASSRPHNILKSIIKRLLKEGPHRLNQIEKVLIHCGYQPRVTVTLDTRRMAKSSSEIAERAFEDNDRDYLLKIYSRSRDGEYEFFFGENQNYIELSGLEFLLNDEVNWRRRGLMGPLKFSLYKHNGKKVSLSDASSGELSLITSLMFIMSEIEDKSLILIDEPENSLHPKWQREYIPMLHDLLGYHDVDIFIATHSPLIVIGAQLDGNFSLEVYHPENGKMELTKSTNIEEMLWGQFETISPASRFLSEILAEQLEAVSSGESSLDQFNEFVKKANEASFDEKQKKLFLGAQEIANKIVREQKNAS